MPARRVQCVLFPFPALQDCFGHYTGNHYADISASYSVLRGLHKRAQTVHGLVLTFSYQALSELDRKCLKDQRKLKALKLLNTRLNFSGCIQGIVSITTIFEMDWILKEGSRTGRKKSINMKSPKKVKEELLNDLA